MEISLRFKTTVAPMLRSLRAWRFDRKSLLRVPDSNRLQDSLAPATRINPIRTLAMVLSLVLMAIPNVVSACPACKDGLHEDGTAAAFAVSILFMMAMPFLIFACWVVAIYRLRVKAARGELQRVPAGFATDPLAEIAAN